MEEKNSSEQIPVNNEAKETNSGEDDFLSLINNLLQFESYIKTLKNINDILTKENLDFFKKLSSKKNIKINLLLMKIYMNIISSDALYTYYLTSIKEQYIL